MYPQIDLNRDKKDNNPYSSFENKTYLFAREQGTERTKNGKTGGRLIHMGNFLHVVEGTDKTGTTDKTCGEVAVSAE